MRPGRPAGGGPAVRGLTAPTVQVGPADKWGTVLDVSWTFPGGNGREVTSQEVKITGAVSETVTASVLTGSRTPDVGYNQAITVTARYCVGQGAAQECRDASGTGKTATPFQVATQALAPLTGTCAAPEPYPGEWRTEADCAPGVWVTAPNPADLLCVKAAVEYLEVPSGNPMAQPKMVNQWYLGIDHNWYRKPALSSPPSNPTC